MDRSLLRNKLSLIGIGLAIISFFLAVYLLALSMFARDTNPYTGIITFFVLPMHIIFGVFLIILGMILERRRRRRQAPEEIPLFPVIDFNSPRTRRYLFWTVGLFVGFLLFSAVGSYEAYHFTDSTTFCGRICHQVMEPEFTAYQNSPHARVACVDCHIGPGADWFVKSKMSGMYQIFATTFHTYPQPIPTPIEDLRPAQETCEQCHWPKQFYGAVQKEIHHFMADEENTPWTINLLLKVGGGNPTYGEVGGIHWHMAISNKIEYIATDEARQEIAWIRQTDPDGRVTIYQSEEAPLEGSPESYEIRTMDCIDCHNRPTHIFRSPSAAMNIALQTGKIDRSLPNIKERGVDVLAAKYETKEAALAAISQEIDAYYQENYPDIYYAKPTEITKAIDAIKTIYGDNFFPYMNARWDVYPENVGHFIWKGCFRCHDGKHVSEEGTAINNDCDSCHVIISQGTGEQKAVSLDGLEFKHPVDIGEAWKEMNCSECHTGALP
ncbi:MAG: cytochrome C [Candidatus Abyssobacteria bacterium SURF_5]|uniref:Cytochrome C n=1 Tax=Abyssobacteria bacterium (strain SURF_5) TaxID=2093360 RepID=A0A3A4NQH4_ABYX5|nr:MAG: cytochrome C [Candidatus Abyssubacteria bacterium SURF_5]